MGKHARTRGPGIDSLTPRGPERWARAAHNALVNPLSKGAKLYVERLTTAHRFVDYEEARLPFQHEEVHYEPNFNAAVSRKRKYVTCNIVCAAMQTQLDIGSTAFHEVAAALAGNYRRSYMWQGQRRYATWQTEASVLDTATLSRSVRCQVCGTTVKKS